MKRAYLALALLAVAAAATAAPAVSGTQCVTVTPEASTGLETVYVARSLQGMTLTATLASPTSAVNVSRYTTLGGAYAEPVTDGVERQGTTLTLYISQGDCGYIIEEDGAQSAFWVVDYAAHALHLDALDIAPEQDCLTAALTLTGDAAPITYYSITGRPVTLSRELRLEYNTLTFDTDAFTWLETPVETLLEDAGTEIHIEAPYCATAFTLTGDRFLEAWGVEQSVTSPMMQPMAVSAETVAERQGGDKPDNQSGGTDSGLGGSAPATVLFRAAVTDAAIYTEWQLSKSSEFEEIEYRESALDFEYTFRDTGTLYARFVCADAAGTCEYISTTYDISIGDSSLLCPNAFSPGTSEGVNDEWKVSYRSLVEYECTIFDRYGKQLFHSTDPAQGWDARRGSGYYPAGVYYYVIKARGSDGKRYNLSGDINIVGYR